MKLFTKIADWWHEFMNRDMGVSDVPDAPDYHQTTVDPLFMEEELVKPPKKAK
jgi:hypothetical protein